MPKTTATIIALIALISAAIHCGSAPADDSTMPSVASTDPSTTQPDGQKILTVDADVLSKAYENNGVRADSEYGGEILRVSGTVRRVAYDLDKNAVIDLGGVEDAPAVSCIFPSAHLDEDRLALIKTLNTGDRIIVIGKVRGFVLHDIQLQAVWILPTDGK